MVDRGERWGGRRDEEQYVLSTYVAVGPTGPLNTLTVTPAMSVPAPPNAWPGSAWVPVYGVTRGLASVTPGTADT